MSTELPPAPEPGPGGGAAKAGSLFALGRLVRWPGVLTAAGNAAAGFLLAHLPDSAGGTDSAVGVICGGALVYAGGVALNDVADADRDGELHPGRPIPTGHVSRRSGGLFGLLLLVGGTFVTLLLAGPHAGLATCAAAVFALLYDFGGKGKRIPGAVLMGLARGANGLAGALAAAGTWGALWGLTDEAPRMALIYPVALLAYTLLLTFISTFEEREPSRAAVATSTIALITVAVLPWPLFTAKLREIPAVAYGLLTATLIVGGRQAMMAGSGLGTLIRPAVFGFLLVDSAWLFGVGKYDYAFWMILAYVALRLALARSRS